MPEAGAEEDDCLHNRPPDDSLVRALARLSETLLAVLQQNNRTSLNRYSINDAYIEIKF